VYPLRALALDPPFFPGRWDGKEGRKEGRDEYHAHKETLQCVIFVLVMTPHP
jgi:hypothetical protein